MTGNLNFFNVYMRQIFFSPRLLAYVLRKRVSKLVAGENVKKLLFFVQMFALISLQNCRHVRAVKSYGMNACDVSWFDKYQQDGGKQEGCEARRTILCSWSADYGKLQEY